MALTWADKRRAYVIGGFVLVGLMLLAAVAIAVFYEAPSCMDRKLNQDETGIDCGGSCQYLCNAEVDPARITFARAIAYGGRTDVVAYIENRNRTAEAKGAKYTAEVYDESGRLLGKKEGMIDLPARATVPLFIPAIAPGVAVAPRAFITFEDDMKWRSAREGQIALKVVGSEILAGEKPRVRATVANPDAKIAYDRTVIATVFDGAGQAIASSRTVVRQVPAFGEAQAVFTWSEPFSSQAARVEVMEVPTLP